MSARYTPEDIEFLASVRTDILSRPDFYRAGEIHLQTRYSAERLHQDELKTWARMKDHPLEQATLRQCAAHTARNADLSNEEPDERDRLERDLHARMQGPPKLEDWSHASRACQALHDLLHDGDTTHTDVQAKAIMIMAVLMWDQDADRRHAIFTSFGPWQSAPGGGRWAATTVLDRDDGAALCRWLDTVRSAWSGLPPRDQALRPEAVLAMLQSVAVDQERLGTIVRSLLHVAHAIELHERGVQPSPAEVHAINEAWDTLREHCFPHHDPSPEEMLEYVHGDFAQGVCLLVNQLGDLARAAAQFDQDPAPFVQAQSLFHGLISGFIRTNGGTLAESMKVAHEMLAAQGVAGTPAHVAYHSALLRLEAEATSRLESNPPNPPIEEGAAVTFLVSEVLTIMDISNSTLNRYAKSAGVATPDRGKKDHRYSYDELRTIFKWVVANVTTRKTVALCRELLKKSPEDLKKIK